MHKYFLGILAIMMPFACIADDKSTTIHSSQIQLNGYVHNKLPPKMIKRIKATTDIFEVVDGISFEKAVDLYKRDLDPEANLVIFEEMARVYKKFCKSRCNTHAERMDVYRALLLRSMYRESEVIAQLEPQVITVKEAKNIMSQYKLPAKPIDVITK